MYCLHDAKSVHWSLIIGLRVHGLPFSYSSTVIGWDCLLVENLNICDTSQDGSVLNTYVYRTSALAFTHGVVRFESVEYVCVLVCCRATRNFIGWWVKCRMIYPKTYQCGIDGWNVRSGVIRHFEKPPSQFFFEDAAPLHPTTTCTRIAHKASVVQNNGFIPWICSYILIIFSHWSNRSCYSILVSGTVSESRPLQASRAGRPRSAKYRR